MRRPATGDRAAVRPGSSYLEVQLAFAVLGVALAGLAPVVVTQLRLMARIEARLPDGVTLHLVPADDPWARKLGVAATLSATDPGPGPAVDDPPAPPRNRVIVATAAVVGPADLASVEVLVEEIPDEPDEPDDSDDLPPESGPGP